MISSTSFRLQIFDLDLIGIPSEFILKVLYLSLYTVLKSIKMNIEEFREYCLSLKGVHEKMPFPNIPDKYSRDVLCFYIADKWFCFVNIEIFDFCCIKCNPEESGELQTTYIGIKPGWHMNKKYWISVYFNQDVPDEKIKELVSKSYDIVVKSLTKKEREMLLSSGE